MALTRPPRSLGQFAVLWALALLLAGCATAPRPPASQANLCQRTPRTPARSLESLTAGCERGEARACQTLGLRYETGDGVPPDLAHAAALFERACTAGDESACVSLAFFLDQGRGVSPDRARALGLLLKSCERSHPEGCSGAAWSLRKGRGAAPDPAAADALCRRARELETRACDEGNDEACVTLGATLMGVMTDSACEAGDVRHAVALFEKTCTATTVKGCRHLGLRYQDGTGVPADARRAVALFEQGCGGGDEQACTQLGLTFFLGVGVPINRQRGAGLLCRSCNGGDGRSCLVLRQEGLLRE